MTVHFVTSWWEIIKGVRTGEWSQKTHASLDEAIDELVSVIEDDIHNSFAGCERVTINARDERNYIPIDIIPRAEATVAERAEEHRAELIERGIKPRIAA